MIRVVEGSTGLRRVPVRIVGKLRQGPGPFAAAVAHHLWRCGPLFRIRRAVAMRGLQPARTDGGAARCPDVPGLVSVVLPVYNQADLLGDSIESVINQTYKHFELIIIDDGSTDGVDDVLRRYVGHPNVRVLRQANQQLPRALSAGFAFARGEFWTWTSADNLMHPEQLARLAGFLGAHPESSMVYADYVAIDDRGEPLADPSFRPENRRPATSPGIHLPRNPRAINVVRDNFIGPCFLYRSIVGRLTGDYNASQGVEDYDYWMRVNHAFRIDHLGTDEALYQYRVHDRSLSGRAGELKIADRAGALMRTERIRNRFYRQPWTLVVDTAMKEHLRGVDSSPHHWLEFGSDLPSGRVRSADPSKVLYLVDSTRLDDLADADRPPFSIVAAWFDDVDAVYGHGTAAATVDAVGFSCRREVAERLDLLGIPNLVIDSPGSFLDLAVPYADNRGFVERSRAGQAHRWTLPQPMVADGTRHVLIQVDDFLQGGLENVVISLARGLRRRGLRVSMLVLGRCGPAAEQARDAGIGVMTLAPGRRAAAYRNGLRAHDVDLVYAHYSTFGARIAADLGIPFVQVVHNTYVWLDEHAVDTYRDADAATTAYLCVSAEVARYCDRRMGLSVDKMVVVPNGVDLGRLDEARSQHPEWLRDELGLSADDFVFLNVASIHATKAQVFLLQALARVVGRRPEVRLVTVGSASDVAYERRLHQRIHDLELERNVVLAGQRADVGRFYWMADAFVLPSLWEGWSLALTEAVCTGLPVVATAVGGARELVARTHGALVRPPFETVGDVEAGVLPRLVNDEDPRFIDDLAVAMETIANVRRRFPLDEEPRRRLGDAWMTDIHFSVLAWLLQGGPATAARAWSRPDGRSGSGSVPSRISA